MSEARGERIGKYLVRRKLAEGGMAEIFLCTLAGPEGFAKDVVVKRIRPSYAGDALFLQRFIAEARLASLLNHANVVQIFDFGREADGAFYLAMEYVRGCSLWELKRRCSELDLGPFPPMLAARIGADVARGLHHAHRLTENGRPLELVHRDVTPHNVLLSADGAVKLADFGVAKASTNPMTASGMLVGKFAYMSPEQAQGEAIDARTDVFALGIVLWELVTGGRLFESDSDIGVLRAVQERLIIPPARMNPDVPPELDAAIMRALEREPGRRFQTAHELERALAEALLKNAKTVEDTDLSAFLAQVLPEETTATEPAPPPFGAEPDFDDASTAPRGPEARVREATAIQRSAPGRRRQAKLPGRDHGEAKPPVREPTAIGPQARADDRDRAARRTAREDGGGADDHDRAARRAAREDGGGDDRDRAARRAAREDGGGDDRDRAARRAAREDGGSSDERERVATPGPRQDDVFTSREDELPRPLTDDDPDGDTAILQAQWAGGQRRALPAVAEPAPLGAANAAAPPVSMALREGRRRSLVFVAVGLALFALGAMGLRSALTSSVPETAGAELRGAISEGTESPGSVTTTSADPTRRGAEAADAGPPRDDQVRVAGGSSQQGVAAVVAGAAPSEGSGGTISPSAIASPTGSAATSSDASEVIPPEPRAGSTASDAGSSAVDDPRGEVMLDVRPWARVVLDGKVLREELTGRLTIRLTPGRHRIKFEHPRITTEKSVEVIEGKRRMVKFNALEER